MPIAIGIHSFPIVQCYNPLIWFGFADVNVRLILGDYTVGGEDSCVLFVVDHRGCMAPRGEVCVAGLVGHRGWGSADVGVRCDTDD